MRPLIALAAMAVAACSSPPTEPFHGTWKIASTSAPGVSTGGAGAVPVGTEVSFGARRAEFGSKVCDTPTYTRRALSRETFAEAYRVAPEQLKLTANQIGMVDILCASGGLDAGSTLIVRSETSMLTMWDGTLYELTR
jgi:hypothetical protein